MNQLTLIADKTQLDTYDDVSISLNYQIEDILDISKRNTSYSKTITLPGTSTNNQFFKQIFDVNIDNVGFNPNKAIPAVLRVSDNQLMSGNLQLKKIINNNGQIEYEVQLTGILKNIVNDFEDRNLRDLDISQYNHIRNKSSITNSWDYINVFEDLTSVNHGGPGEGYVYPYIINGGRDDIDVNLLIGDCYPAPYLKMIWDKMFEGIGKTYTSNFINSEYFKKLILPYTGDRIQKDAATLLEEKVIVGIDSSTTYENLSPVMSRNSDWWYNNTSNYYLPLTRESGTVTDSIGDITFTDGLDQWRPSGTADYFFNCKTAGYYNVGFDGKLIVKYDHEDGDDIEFNSGALEYSYELQKVKTNGTVIVLDSSGTDPLPFAPSPGEHATPWYDTAAPLQMNVSADNVYLEIGEKIRVQVGFKYPKVNWVGLDDNKHTAQLTLKQSLDGSFTKFEVVQATNDSLGNEVINMNAILDSNIKQKDFFLDIIKMFNLVLQDNPNKPNDVIIEPRDDYYKSKERVLDWTDIVDRDSDITITPMSEIDAKTYLYKYKDDSDFYNESYMEAYNESYGQLSIDVQNDFSDKVNKTEIKFSPTASADRYTNGRVAPHFATFEDPSFQQKKVNTRILFYGGRVASEPFYLKDDEGDVGDVQYSYAYCGMWDHPTNPIYDLAFGRTKTNYFNFSVIPHSNLYEQFHKATLNNVIDENSRMMEAFIHLTPKDIAEFDFRDMIFIDGSYWRVNKISDYDPVGSDSLTKVVLYKLIDVNILSPFQVKAPQSNASCPFDMIGVDGKSDGKGGGRSYYASASGLEVTADCCKSIGGNFQNGICYADSGRPDGKTDGRINDRYVLPVSEPMGPEKLKQNNNTNNTLGVKVYGKSNYVAKGTRSALIVGDNNSVDKNVSNTIVVGDGIKATESGTIYLGDIKVSQDGTITSSGLNTIDGGADTVFPFDKTNLIDVIDGGKDSIRNFGGDSKARPRIDGNI